MTKYIVNRTGVCGKANGKYVAHATLGGFNAPLITREGDELSEAILAASHALVEGHKSWSVSWNGGAAVVSSAPTKGRKVLA